MTTPELSRVIGAECARQGLLMNESLPIKITADCYIVYCTPKTHECTKNGHCRVHPYYALTGGETIQIIEVKK